MSRSTRRFAALAQLGAVAVVLGACAAATPSGTSRLAIGNLDTALPVHSMLERRFATVVRQQYDFSCGSAALATLLRYHYGKQIDEPSTFLGM